MSSVWVKLCLGPGFTGYVPQEGNQDAEYMCGEWGERVLVLREEELGCPGKAGGVSGAGSSGCKSSKDCHRER